VPSTLSLKEELALGKTGNEETMLLNPRAVEVDQAGNIYVIDGKAVQIKVYDPQGNFIRAIGRRGQGPGGISNHLELPGHSSANYFRL